MPGPLGRPGPVSQRADGGAGQAGPERMLRFASERKALADPGELRNLDPDALRRYLSFQYVPPPGTLTPPVQVLPPGHAMIARPGGAWTSTATGGRTCGRPALPAMPRPAPSWTRCATRSPFICAATLRWARSCPAGSTPPAICALAAEHRPDLLTFTVGFEREGYSEIDRPRKRPPRSG